MAEDVQRTKSLHNAADLAQSPLARGASGGEREGDSVVLAAVLQAIVATTEMRRTYERQTGCNIAAGTR